MNRDKNIAVFKDTLEKANTIYKYDGIIDNMTIYPNPALKKKDMPVNMPNIHVTPDDCTLLINDKRHGILIDSASLKHAGGGVRNGSNAQEENLCRQSNLYKAIEQLQFPLHGKTYGVYVPRVTFYKQSAAYAYAPIDTGNKVIDIVMLFSRPRNVFSSEYESYNHHLTAFKSLITFANKYNIEYIILPPIGSGVFGNDPEIVATALKDALNMYELKTVKDIYIACFTEGQNYTAYRKIFDILE